MIFTARLSFGARTFGKPSLSDLRGGCGTPNESEGAISFIFTLLLYHSVRAYFEVYFIFYEKAR